jgi:hypothetical protein
MRVNYSFLDQTAGRTHSDIAFWGNIAVAGTYDGFRVFNGRIYANDMTRGQDVESILLPYTPYGQHWTQLNAQTQEDLYLPSITALGQLSPTR